MNAPDIPAPRPLRALGEQRRQIIQFQAVSDHTVIALCSDGSLWRGGVNHWQRFMAIPQGEPTLPNVGRRDQ